MECTDDVCSVTTDNVTTTVSVPLPNPTDSWTVYGASWCKFCTAATEFINGDLKSNFVMHDVDSYGGIAHVIDSLGDLVGTHKTIPMIFYNGKFVGGFSDLKNLDQTTTSQKSQKTLVGCFSQEKPIDDEVREIVMNFYEDFNTPRYEPTEYKSQVVAGKNLLVRVLTSDTEAAHLKIFCPLPYANEEPRLVSAKFPMTHSDPL